MITWCRKSCSKLPLTLILGDTWIEFGLIDYSCFYLSVSAPNECSIQVQDNTNRPLGLSKGWPWLLHRGDCLIRMKFKTINPLTLMSDQGRISLYNIYTISTKKVMRIKKNINLGIISWFNTKFSELTL